MRKTGSKQQTFVDVKSFLFTHHENLLDLYKRLALDSRLRVRASSGMTFLLPSAAEIKSYESRLEKDDVTVAADLMALIIPVHLPTVDHWKALKDDLPNSAGKCVPVEKAESSGITFANKATATLCKDYKMQEKFGDDIENRLKTVVYDLKGSSPVGTKRCEFKNIDRKTGALKKKIEVKKSKRGGFHQPQENKLENIALIRKTLTDQVLWLYSDRQEVSPMLDFILKAYTGCEDEEEKKLMELVISGSPLVEFFLLVDSPYFNSKSVMEAVERGSDVSNRNTYLDILKKRKDMSDKIENIKMDAGDDNSAVAHEVLEEAYRKIGEVLGENGYESELTRHLHSLDDFCFAMCNAYESLYKFVENTSSDDTSEISKCVAQIVDLADGFNGEIPGLKDSIEAYCPEQVIKAEGRGFFINEILGKSLINKHSVIPEKEGEKVGAKERDRVKKLLKKVSNTLKEVTKEQSKEFLSKLKDRIN